MTQEATQLSTTPPYPGLQMVEDINKLAQTLGTDFAGSTDPAELAWPYSVWADTGTGTLKRRNAANSAWMIERNLFEDLRRTTSATDTTAGRVLKVGDFGIGEVDAAPLAVDLNNLPASGSYRIFDTTLNRPLNYGTVFEQRLSAAEKTQIAISVVTEQVYFRKYQGGPNAWSAWREMYHSGNLPAFSVDPYAAKIIGEEFSIHPNAPLPPTDNPNFRYIALTAGLTGVGQYNEGVLTSETVTGSDPKITATAVVSLAGSPLDGQTIDLINTSRVFLRPGPAAGPIVNSQNLAHTHTGSTNSSGNHTHTIGWFGTSGGGTYSTMANNGAAGAVVNQGTSAAGSHSHTVTINSSGGSEANPRYIPRVYLMRIL